jgi:hypothetical protein
MDIQIRAYDSIGDEAFVLSTWMKSYRDAGAVRSVPTPIYNIGQRHRIMGILRDIETYILVACDKETPELIYGYAVCRAPNVVHYLYTKNTYRQGGVGKALLQHLNWKDPIFYTHKSADIWVEQKLKDDVGLINCIHNPYLLETY